MANDDQWRWLRRRREKMSARQLEESPMAATKTTTAKSKEAVQHAADTLEHYTAVGQEKMRENVDRSIAAMAEFGAFGKENVEAFVASMTAASKGWEALTARTVAFSKAAMENHVAATKAIMGAKSVQEAVERQSEYAKASFEGYVAELNKMSDLMTGMTKDAAKPLNERMTAVGAIMQTGLKTVGR
jgi:phasin family protein